MPGERDRGGDRPDWLENWPDNIGDTSILTAERRGKIAGRFADQGPVTIEGSEHPHLVRDGGEVLWVCAVVDGKESTPGAMIMKRDGVIVKLADGITAEHIDEILEAMSQASA